MSSPTKRRKEISPKHFGVIKSSELQSNKKVMIRPVKVFDLSQQESKLEQGHEKKELEVKDKSQDINQTSQKKQQPEIEEKKDDLSIIQAPDSEPDVDTREVMKRNINAEMNQYREEQIKSIQNDLELIKKKVHDETFEKAKKEGEQVFIDKTNEMIARGNELIESIKQLGSSKNENLFEKRDLVIKLAVAMAEKIIKKQVALDEESFHTFFSEAFDKVTDKDQVVIEINPEDKASLEEYQKTFEDKFKDINNLSIRTNPEIQQGGCTIETDLGYIDATVSSKLDLLYKAIDEFHRIEDQVKDLAPIKVEDASAKPEEPKPKEKAAQKQTEEQPKQVEEDKVEVSKSQEVQDEVSDDSMDMGLDDSLDDEADDDFDLDGFDDDFDFDDDFE